MKLDVLAFGAHPDDVELACSGTLVKLARAGKKVGVVDLTQGELGTRGSAPLRLQEAAEAAKILGLEIRENLDLGDGWFEIDQENVRKVITMIRRYRPEIILLNAIDDRHPDHPRAARLVKEAAFRSGLEKIRTTDGGQEQERWRAPHQFHYIQFRHIPPHFVVDISDTFTQKMASIKAYRSQFYDPDSQEKSTLISSAGFLEFIEARAREHGAAIGSSYGEGFTSDGPLPLDLGELL